MSNQSEQIGELAKALAAAQGDLEGARKTAQNPHLKNRYADLADVWDACRAALAAHGLAVAQTTDFDGDTDYLVTTLMHGESGQWKAGRLRLRYSDGEKGRSIMQAMGSAVTYARRYALAAMVGVVQEDDDGQSAGRPERRERRDERPAAPAKANGALPPKDFAELADRAVRRWAKFAPLPGEPEAAEREWTARLNRILQDAVTAAVAECDGDGKPLIDEAKVCRKNGKGQAVRDPKLCWEAMEWLFGQDPDWCRAHVAAYVEAKRQEAEPEVVEAGSRG